MARFASLTSTLVVKNKKLTSIPSQTDYADFITGQVYTETAGKLFVEESFDLPVFPGKLINTYGGIVSPASNATTPSHWEGNKGPTVPTIKQEEENAKERKESREKEEEKFLEEWAKEGHWSICTYPEEESGKAQALAEFAVGAKATLSFTAYASAPFWRLTFEAGAADTKELRVYARAFERGKV